MFRETGLLLLTATKNALGDLIEDRDAPAPEKEAIFVALREKLDEALNTLSDREREILKLRFGLKDGRRYMLEEIGRIFGVTRERIPQIEKRAKRQLRPKLNKELRDFMGL